MTPDGPAQTDGISPPHAVDAKKFATLPYLPWALHLSGHKKTQQILSHPPRPHSPTAPTAAPGPGTLPTPAASLGPGTRLPLPLPLEVLPIDRRVGTRGTPSSLLLKGLRDDRVAGPRGGTRTPSPLPLEGLLTPAALPP